MGKRHTLLAPILLILAACGGGDGADPPTSQAPLSTIVAFMGDSIIYYWNLPAVKSATLINDGVSGETTANMLARFNEVVISAGSGVVVIEGGINDLVHLGAAANTDSIAAMAAQAKAAGLRVILCAVMPASSRYNATLPQIQSWNAQVLALALANGYLYADTYDAMMLPDGRQNARFFRDGLHPNTFGYARMWTVLQPLIAEDLEVKSTAP